MALPEVGQPYVPSTAAEIRDLILADLRLESLNQVALGYASEEAAVSPYTDNWAWSTSLANMFLLAFANIEGKRTGITPFDAQGDDLEAWRIALDLPEVTASPAAGMVRVTILAGSPNIPANTEFVFPNGLRGKTRFHELSVSDGQEIHAIAIDTGAETNFEGNTPIRFTSPPTNVATDGFVSRNVPFTGGYDGETESRKRARVLNKLGGNTGGGAWRQYREIALNALASVQDCYVFPTLGGPSSVKFTPVRDFDIERNEFTRALPSAAMELVRNAVFAEMPDAVENVGQAPADELVDVAISVTLPESVFAGGDGSGWRDLTPWPDLVPGDSGRVTVTAVSNSRTITVSANTTTTPIAGQTHVSWWASNQRKFYSFLVTAVSGSAGAWVLTLDRSAADNDGVIVAVGDYICPDAVNGENYGKSWIQLMRVIGTGENVSNIDTRAPRALRHPYPADESPYGINFPLLREINNLHPEITDIGYEYRSASTPTIPATVDDPPNVFVPRHFGVYRIA